ncbi:hypothetical protein QC761_0058230 [Podospora bellae-mahoneyi]|uniref:Uncharacterized protein n=1 Tax=Podospora bellae-mahoneyi TaxID=2093777 RepID=A0ABR0FPU2_9PEZI|nr:hypothetical protein QC761_0058230 [Podospora bellae-mahoneyi]
MENYLSGADTPKRGANKAGHILGGIMKTSGNKLWAATDPLSSNMAAHAWKPSRRSFLLQPRSALVIPGIPSPTPPVSFPFATSPKLCTARPASIGGSSTYSAWYTPATVSSDIMVRHR